MSKFSLRLKELRNSKKLTQQNLADLLGISKSSVNMYERGEREPGIEMLEALADFFNVDLDYLLGKSNIPNMALEKSFKLPEGAVPYNPIHRIPLLGEIAAGMPLYAEEHIEGYIYTDHNGGAEYFALRIKGDSMTAANIPNDSIVVVRIQAQVNNGEIAAVRVNNNRATVKRFKQDKNIVQLIPQSYNPEHQIQIYDLKTDKIDILGKIVECKTYFN